MCDHDEKDLLAGFATIPKGYCVIDYELKAKEAYSKSFENVDGCRPTSGTSLVCCRIFVVAVGGDSYGRLVFFYESESVSIRKG